jgi:hypothetical protein
VPPPYSNAYFAQAVTALVRLGKTGTLDAATWLGGPSEFAGHSLCSDHAGNVFVIGASRYEQWFITPGSLQDDFQLPREDTTLFQAMALVKIFPRLRKRASGNLPA